MKKVIYGKRGGKLQKKAKMKVEKSVKPMSGKINDLERFCGKSFRKTIYNLKKVLKKF